MKKIKIVSLLGLILIALQSVVLVSPSFVNAEDNVSRSYSTKEELPTGNVVALDNNSGDTVVPANTSNAGRTVGVVVRINDSLIGIEPNESKVQVATSGLVKTMVSTARGEIRTGDKLSVSALSGVAQKAAPGEVIVGFAKSGFTGNEENTSNATLTNTSGQTKNVKVGIIEVELAIGSDNPANTTTSLNGLQQLVQTLTGKSVSMPRIIASIIIAILTLLSLAALVYASIYGSIISIGRNPLARGSIMRGLIVVLAMAGLGVALSMLIIFLLLR